MVEKLLQVLVFAKLPDLHGFRKTSSVSETVFIVIVSKTCKNTFLHHSHQDPFGFCLPAGKNIDISICFGLVVVYCSTGPVFARAYTVDPPEIAEDISFLQKDKHYLFEIAKDISWGQRKPEIYLSQEDIST